MPPVSAIVERRENFFHRRLKVARTHFNLPGTKASHLAGKN